MGKGPRALWRRSAKADCGPVGRGAGRNSGEVRRGIYVGPEAGAALAGERLSGGLPRVGGVVPGGVYVRHHGGQRPAAPLSVSPVQKQRVYYGRLLRLRSGHAR